MFTSIPLTYGQVSLGMNTSGDEPDLPSYFSHFLSSVLPFHTVPATLASSSILGQVSCAPASWLSYLLALYPRLLQAWLSNGLQALWTHLPCPPCPSHSFSVVFNTVSLRMSSTDLSFSFSASPHAPARM